MARNENLVDRFIREHIRLAREEAGESQEQLAGVLHKNRVAVSGMERGRVRVGASELLLIAAHFRKPVAYFFPKYVPLGANDKLTELEEELLSQFRGLPEPQQYIALEYLNQQRKMVEIAMQRSADEEKQYRDLENNDLELR